jgi:hypothetical protein
LQWIEVRGGRLVPALIAWLILAGMFALIYAYWQSTK